MLFNKREYPIQPSPDSELGREWLRLEAMHAELREIQQHGKQLEEQRSEADREWSRRAYRTPVAGDQAQIDAFDAQRRELATRLAEHNLKVEGLVLARFNEAEAEFRRKYNPWLERELADQARRLG